MEPIGTFILVGLGLLMALFGLAACVLPVVPGPPISYLSLLLLSWARDWKPFGTTFLVVMAAATALALLLDYIVPAAGARRYGASKFGVWGSILGMLVGLFVFPPFGLFVGGFVGALAGELYAGKDGDGAMRAGVGVLVGTLIGVGIKMGLCGVMIFFYVKGMFA
jgi:hypothetical protein